MSEVACASRCMARPLGLDLHLVLFPTDAVRTWRRLAGKHGDVSGALLDKCGVWGCVLGGVVASSIAQCVLTRPSCRRFQRISWTQWETQCICGWATVCVHSPRRKSARGRCKL